MAEARGRAAFISGLVRKANRGLHYSSLLRQHRLHRVHGDFLRWGARRACDCVRDHGDGAARGVRELGNSSLGASLPTQVR